MIHIIYVSNKYTTLKNMFILNLTSNRDIRHYQIKENFVISQMKCDASSNCLEYFSVTVLCDIDLAPKIHFRFRLLLTFYDSVIVVVSLAIFFLEFLNISMQNFYLFPFIFFQLVLSKTYLLTEWEYIKCNSFTP